MHPTHGTPESIARNMPDGIETTVRNLFSFCPPLAILCQNQLSYEPMTSFSSLRVRLVGTVLLFITPAWVLMYYTHLPWSGFILGLLALGAAWFGGERFILRQLRDLARAAQRLAAGDLTSRTGMANEESEFGQLARTFDGMAATLEQRVKEREQAEKTLLNRSFQQTVVSALGQFSLARNDFSAFLKQAVMLVAQPLEVEYCQILELPPDGQSMLLRAGVGWKDGCVGVSPTQLNLLTQPGFTLTAGEPVVVGNLGEEKRFTASALMKDHGVVSGITVAISGHGQPFGILGAHTTHRRKFIEDGGHFLLAVATVLAMAVERNRAETELQKLAAFAQLNPNPAMELSAHGEISDCNDAARTPSPS